MCYIFWPDSSKKKQLMLNLIEVGVLIQLAISLLFLLVEWWVGVFNEIKGFSAFKYAEVEVEAELG